MADELNSENQAADINIKNLKVSDLRKKLKDLGLPTAGTKSELIEKLQEAMLGGKGLESNSDLDSALLEETNEINSVSDTLDEKDDDILDEEIALASPTKLKDTSASEILENASVKEQEATHSSDATSQNPKVEKKIVLKRNHIPILKMAPSKPVEDPKDVAGCSAPKEIDEKTSAAEDSGKESPKIINLTTKNRNEEEKIILRSKRFNILAPGASSGKLITVEDPKSGEIILSPVNAAPTLEVLQKRAERFGGNVSLVMKLMEEKEKLLKRKRKFGDVRGGTGMNSSEDEERKRKRAERFKQQ